MKKILAFFLTIIIFGTVSPICAKNMTDITTDIGVNADETVLAPEKAFFTFLRKKKKEAKKALNIPENGYRGVLPDIEAEFEYKKETTTTSPKSYEKVEPYGGLLIDAPQDDPLFLDVIMKKGKETTYVDDVVKIRETLEKLRSCIVNQRPIQFFNANVNVLDLQIKKIEKKYSNTPWAYTNSYYALVHVNYSAKILGNLKYDANFYSRYMPVSDTDYSKDNIEKQSILLIDEIDRTIFEIGNIK